MGIRIEKKSGRNLVRSISKNIENMLKSKIHAVKCLYKEAERINEEWQEDFAENFTYYSSKHSLFIDETSSETSEFFDMQVINQDETYK